MRDAHLFFIERGLREGDHAAVCKDRPFIEQFFHDRAALYEVLFGDRLCMFGGHLRIEGALGIHDHDGAERAETETAGLYEQDVVDAEFFHRSLELRDDLHRVGRGTARTAAYEDLMTVTGMYGELFRLFFYEAANVDKLFFALTDRVEFLNRHLLASLCSSRILPIMSGVSFP